MFVTIHGQEAVNTLAQQIGCQAGEAGVDRGYGNPALAGNTFAIKDQIKAAGGRWSGLDKAWTFDSFAALEAFLLTIINK